MKIKLALYIITLITVILLLSTYFNYYHSGEIIEYEINNQAKILTSESKKSINAFLNHIKDITYLIAKDDAIKTYLKDNYKNKKYIEDKLLNYNNHIGLIQALRITDLEGNIKIFIREGKILSRLQEFSSINISQKNFFKKILESKGETVLLSNFERGKLPETTKFCPAMIRTMFPIFVDNQKYGYLIINFWGLKIGEFISKIKPEIGFAFLVEVNLKDNDRNGIFLFHKNKYYEFANQYNTKYYFQNIYGDKYFQIIKNNKSGIININDNIMAFDSIYPYKDKNQKWIVCTVLYSSYYFNILNVLKRNLFSILSFSIFLSILVSLIFSSRFLKPIKYIKNALNIFGSGNLDYKINTSNMDKELKEIADSIQNMAQSLRGYICEIQDKQKKMELLNRLSSIGLLSAGISHELNSPLNSILLLCDLLLKNFNNTGTINIEDIKAIKEEAKKCVEIIYNLKLLDPKYRSSDIRDVIDLKDVIEKIVIYLQKDFSKINFKMKLESCKITGNRTLIQQAILNIVLNSIDAVKECGKININLKRNNNMIILEIEDNGEGIDESILGEIFNPFYTTKSPDKGMGLGLSLVYKIINDHKGMIDVESKKGIGTKFIIRFKVYEDSFN
jgi:signal transduction histidine kinase